MEVDRHYPITARSQNELIVTGSSHFQYNSDSVAQVTPEQRPYQPFGACAELMRYRGREVLLAGPAGTGKSRAALEKLSFVAYNRPIRAAIVRKVRKSLTQAALVTFEQKVLPEPSGVRFWTEDQEYRYPNGAVIALAGLDDPEKVKSTEFDLIYVQEATELDDLDWELLVSRLRNGVLSYQQIIGDCNPADPHHWLKQRCDRGECFLLDTRHQDNPQLYDHGLGDWTTFGRQYLATLDTLTGYTYKRLRLGIWCSAEGMFFTEWDPDKHVVEPFDIPEHWPRWTAIDYGFAAPWCCLWLARDPNGSRPIYVYRERYQVGLRDEEQAQLVADISADDSVLCHVLDPSMFNTRTEQNRPSIAAVYQQALGAEAMIIPGQNNRRTGWAVLRRALAHDKTKLPRLRLFKGRAPTLERTLPALVHDPLDAEDVADKLHGSKTEDHAPDALRYGLGVEAGPEADSAIQDISWG